ncbi:MAG: carboxymuconolactone decarboxylase family protein [Acidobacteriaceae bacterium]
MDSMKERIEEVNTLIERLKANHPSEINAFLSFMGKTENGPALTKAQKELINIALSVAAQCEWCIAVHVKSAIAAGATRDEIMEAGFLTVLMHGGPALMHLTYLTRALDEFIPEK